MGLNKKIKSLLNLLLNKLLVAVFRKNKLSEEVC